jgi:hypothetical protein
MMGSKLRFAASINHAPAPPEHKFGEAVSLSSQCVLHTAVGATFVSHSSPQTSRIRCDHSERSQSESHEGILEITPLIERHPSEDH